MDSTNNIKNTFEAYHTKALLAARKTKLPFSPVISSGKFFCAHRGTSMNPTLSRHDLLEIAAYQKKKPATGDVAIFLPPDNKDYFVHRIVSAGSEGFITRGDNNKDIDPWILREKDFCGRVIAAHQGDKRRKIGGGFPGRLTGFSRLARRKTNGLLVKILRPVYRSLCTGGILRWLFPVRLTPQVATFRSGKNGFHKLLLGNRIIGSYDESLLQWQIRRPYRLFVDESSLPTPR